MSAFDDHKKPPSFDVSIFVQIPHVSFLCNLQLFIVSLFFSNKPLCSSFLWGMQIKWMKFNLLENNSLDSDKYCLLWK